MACERTAGIAGTGIRFAFQVTRTDHTLREMVRTEKVAVDVLTDARFTGQDRDGSSLQHLGNALPVVGYTVGEEPLRWLNKKWWYKIRATFLHSPSGDAAYGTRLVGLFRTGKTDWLDVIVEDDAMIIHRLQLDESNVVAWLGALITETRFLHNCKCNWTMHGNILL